MLRSFARELIEQHGAAFKDPNAKDRVGAMLRRLLPPRRRPGRPGFVSVSAAIQLHAELKRSSPEKSNKEIWREIYRRLIPRWEGLCWIERRSEADQLHQRAHWRVYAQKRKDRKPRTGKLTR